MHYLVNFFNFDVTILWAQGCIGQLSFNFKNYVIKFRDLELLLNDFFT